MSQFISIWALFVSPIFSTAEEDNRGYPLFFGSFGDVGKTEITSDVQTVQYVDDRITDWTRGCPADAFSLIKDSTPFQLTGSKKLQRLGENSSTRGSFLTDYLVNMHELALDLEEYCDGLLVEVIPSTNLTNSPKPVDVQTRVFYVEFDKDTSPAKKDEMLTEVLTRIASPFVTVAYTSSFQQSHPILRSLTVNPKRKSWQRSKSKHKKDNISPIVAPSPWFNPRQTGHSAPEAHFELPDNFFLTSSIGSVVGVSFLAYRDIQRWFSKRKDTKAKSKEPVSDSQTEDSIKDKKS